MQTYHLEAGATALPLTLAGLGVIAGSLAGGRVANRRDRVPVLAHAVLGGGLAAALAFTIPLSPWLTVILACAVLGVAACEQERLGLQTRALWGQ
jgi:predicted MFS family arabinose efflux permease